MLKGRGRDPRTATAPLPARPHTRPAAAALLISGSSQRTPLNKPEPDYEVVEFPSDQYVNAKLQPPPPPPPRPPTGHPTQAAASCGLCGGGGARVRCSECGRQALCASCDDMYHRHPKRRNHQRQALTLTQLAVDERPPLPPKGTPPVPPPRRHKISASPKPSTPDLRRATLGHPAVTHGHPGVIRASPVPANNHVHHMQPKMATGNHLGSMPYLPTTMQHPAAAPPHAQHNVNTLGHLNAGWNRPRGSLQGFNMQHVVPGTESWENPEIVAQRPIDSWGRPLRRGASVLELGGAGAPGAGGVECGGCAAAAAWRYGSCAALDQSWHPAWPTPSPPAPFMTSPHAHLHPVQHPPQTPQSYRRADVRPSSRAVSRSGSRAVSPALSMRSRASRRTKHRTPSPPALPSSDADSESESESERGVAARSPGPGPPPAAPAAAWHCEHCTFLNEAGVRVCAVCCRTPTTAPAPANLSAQVQNMTLAPRPSSSARIDAEVSQEKNGKLKSERVSTGCGPSPPKEERISKAKTQRLETPNREQNGTERPQPSGNRHDMGVGPSPPRENLPREKFITRESRADIPHQEAAQESRVKTPTRHSVSVGPSPPRENASASKPNQKSTTPLSGQKKSTGTSPPPEVKVESPHSSRSSKTRVSNTGTSPPPQSISTQTYEDPNTWERAPSACRSRARRRLREDARRERSRSRHSLSSDTRESDRSVRTTGAWEWRERERDVSPAAAPRRRASHLDLRRLRRRDSLYGSEATSPERERWGGGGRAVSMEALAGGGREAERGLELARLLADAERLGFNAAEVQAALSQSPGAPLSWLKTRWAGLTGAVRGAAARLAQRAPSERDARAALARHRGAVWPAVTDCVDALRRQEGVAVSAERRVRGRVWGSPAGAEDEAAPGARADDSSDELEAGGPYLDEWDPPPDASDDADRWSPPPPDPPEDIPRKLRSLLARAGVAHVDEGLLRRLLSADGRPHAARRPYPTASTSAEFAHFENDFIDAYNALTRASPLPSKDTKYRDGNVANGDTLPNGGTNIEKNNKLQIPTSEVLHFAEANGIDQNHNFIPINENSIPKNPIIPDNIEKKNTNSENFQTVSVNNTTDLTNTENIEKVIQIENKPVDPVVQKNNLVYKSNIPKEQTEEKPNNLNEIVDNTQRLIQQMKDEINSDINSLDGRQSETSQSEHESSSHDEQESSYNETEGDSDQSSMTSDESRDFSEEESARVVHGPNDDNSAIISRTSSEENEEFEEALDHIDEQVKNIDEQVKNINMDILNSIAKSLQNDLTISLEKEIQESETEEADTNDNLFVAVNTFEEIYEELNTKNKPNNIQAKNNKEKPIQPKIILTKHLVTEMTFESVTPTKLMLTNKREQVLNAELDTIQIEVSEEESPNEEDTLPELTQIEEQVNADADNSATTDSATINSVTHGTESSNVINENIDIAVENNIAGDKSNQDAQSPVLENKIEIQTEPTFDTRSNEIQTEPTFDTSSNENQMETISDTSLSVISSSNDLNNRKDIKDDNNVTKVPVNTKSNIPKPVKTIQKSKDKLTPKLLVSKVPVRKTSTKQYPAPAPPKSHFGNVQNGHVKQLQNKIFNNSTNTPIVEKPAVAKDEPKPSTSAGIKNPAPRPPINKENVKQESPPKMAPKPKKNYFRETCRTEDEWTDSDSDDQSQILRPIEEKPSPTRASPPPPITLRRVSGNVIDLATVRLPEGSPERQARMLLAEGATETWEQAQLAVELISRGADPPVALLAALECADLSAALAYLHQDCELCASRFPEHEMVSMLRCTHRCCRECARLYFNVQITERSIADCVCPFCKMPELENLPEDAWLEYFAHLDILLKTLLETDVHELFQRKLRDRTLARDPNFRWCMECSSGFFVHPKHKKIRCPECRSVSCATCRKPWTPNHEGLTCEQYTAWLDDNDPERSVTAVQQHLRENGLECPRCHFKYSLSRGGCMHFTCTQCKYEFCYGCGKPFMMGARCGLSDYCAKLGLHAHHPRNCLFYLRDKEPHELQTLLQMNNVAYETEAPEGSTGRCPIQLQRETPTGLVDAVCGHEVPPKHAGLCKAHYVELLAARARPLDPLPIMALSELVAELRRRALPLPERGPWDSDPVYAGMCAEIVKEKIPLD